MRCVPRPEVQGQASCPMHPLKKQPFTENRYIDYAADMTVALMYHKCLDDASDDGSRAAKVYARALKKGYGDVRRRWPRQTDALEAGLRDIGRIEVSPESNPDAAAKRFGDIMAQLVVFDEADFWAQALGVFGYQLGRFIYMMDAAVDLPEDAQSGSYNPLVDAGFTVGELRQLLANYMAGVAAAFERMPLVQDDHLLRSVVYAGVWARFNKVYEDIADDFPAQEVRRDSAKSADAKPEEPGGASDCEGEVTDAVSDEENQEGQPDKETVAR